jgi:cell division protein FtsZ
MTLNLSVPGNEDLRPRIAVFGVGGAGGNAVNNMIDKNLEGAEFVVANTDAQALQQSKSPTKIQMGVKVTEGLGAGARPSVGAASAEETIEEIVDHLAGSHMAFITAGMGGGTGTGAAPIIAQAARELGVLTVGVVTKPFQFEGAKRMRQAEEGVEALQKVVDTLIIIPNQNLFRLANEKTTFTEAFTMADDVLYQGVKGITDLMVRPGLINLDFADVRAVMDEMGKAMMGTGEAAGEDRAIQAAEKAIANPLLDEISLRGARGVLINITGGHDLTLFELDEAANRIREEVDPEANIIVGSTLDETLDGMMRVSVVATGIDASEMRQELPLPRRTLAKPLQAEPAPTIQAPPVEPIHYAPPQATAPIAAQYNPVDQSPEYASAAPAQPVMAPSYLAPQAADVGQPHQQPIANQQSLFADFTASDPVEEVESLFTAPQSSSSLEGLPEPVYQPERKQFGASMETNAIDNDPLGFVAPKPPSPGMPSADALARLRAAVGNAPEPAVAPVHQPSPIAIQQPVQSVAQPAAPAPQMVAPAPQPAPVQEAPKPRQEPEKTARFGINNLISRMTGQNTEAASTHADRADEQGDSMVADTETQKVEIPAFLRRQAN